ncbi:hypothetical protein C0993_004514, partial [Termitomyces sp. T159_Od127]
MSENLLEDLKGAELLVIKLDQGSLTLQVVLVKPDKGARGPVEGDFAMSIGVLGICFVGNIDFVLKELMKGLEVLKELMKGLEVLNDFVDYVRGEVSEGK